MLQGSLAAALLPNSITPLLIAQYASLHHLGGNAGQQMRITAVGIGQFGSCCTRLLAYSTHSISCREVLLDPQRATVPDLAELNSTLLHCDLMFLLADAAQSSSDPTLAACCHAAAAAGVQTVMVGPYGSDHPLSALFAISSPPPNCLVANPTTARDLVVLVADLANTDGFVGIDHSDIKAILRSGNHCLFASSNISGEDRGALACRQALGQLQQQNFDSVNCRGAMACIYSNTAMPFDCYEQANTVMRDYFSKGCNVIFGAFTDEHLAAGTIRFAILAMQ